MKKVNRTIQNQRDENQNPSAGKTEPTRGKTEPTRRRNAGKMWKVGPLSIAPFAHALKAMLIRACRRSTRRAINGPTTRASQAALRHPCGLDSAPKKPRCQNMALWYCRA